MMPHILKLLVLMTLVINKQPKEELIMRKVKKPHWYFFSTTECVLCGRTKIIKERRYGKKPKDFHKRHEWQQEACWSHFI